MSNNSQSFKDLFRLSQEIPNQYPIYWSASKLFMAVFSDPNCQVSFQDWKDLWGNWTAHSYWVSSYRFPIYRTLQNLGFRGVLLNRNDLNQKMIADCFIALAESDESFCKDTRSYITNIFVRTKDDKEAFIKLNNFCSLLYNSKIIKNKDDILNNVVRKSTASRFFVDALACNITTLSAKNNTLFFKKLEKLFTQQKANAINSGTVACALKHDIIQSWILKHDDSDKIITGLNRYLSKFSGKDYFQDNFRLVRFYYSLNNSSSQIMLDMQKYYIQYVATHYSTYSSKIEKFLSLEGSSPRKALLQLTEMGVDCKFLLKKFPELSKLMIIA